MREHRRDEPDTPADHWKYHLIQKPTRIPTRADFSGEKRVTAGARRRWATILRNTGIVIFFAGVCSLGWLALHEGASAPDATSSTAALDFKSDGDITTDWVRDLFADESKMPPIFDIKRRLEAIPQVRHAEVRRDTDGTVVIRVQERRPVARIVVKPPGRGPVTRLVSSEGIIYDGVNVGQLTFANLPVLRDVSVRSEVARGYNVIEDFVPVAEFLDYAREKYPSIYRDWLVVSLKNYSGQADAPDALIQVQPRLNSQSPDSAALVEILFSPSGYKSELEHLDNRNARENLRQKLAAADKTRFPAFRLDLSIINSSDPARPYEELRLIPVAPRQP